MSTHKALIFLFVLGVAGVAVWGLGRTMRPSAGTALDAVTGAGNSRLTSGSEGDDDVRRSSGRNREGKVEQVRDQKLLDHYSHQLLERTMPWNEVMEFLDDLKERLPPERFRNMTHIIAHSAKYSVAEKAEMLKRFAPIGKEGSDFLQSDVMNYFASIADAESARTLVDMLGDPCDESFLTRAYYNQFYATIPKLLELITSDIPNEHPLLAGRSSVANRIAGLVIGMEAQKVATPQEVIAAIQGAKVDEDFKRTIEAEIRRRCPEAFGEGH